MIFDIRFHSSTDCRMEKIIREFKLHEVTVAVELPHRAIKNVHQKRNTNENLLKLCFAVLNEDETLKLG